MLERWSFPAPRPPREPPQRSRPFASPSTRRARDAAALPPIAEMAASGRRQQLDLMGAKLTLEVPFRASAATVPRWRDRNYRRSGEGASPMPGGRRWTGGLQGIGRSVSCRHAPVAQMDRAPHFESVGCRFMPRRAHQRPTCWLGTLMVSYLHSASEDLGMAKHSAACPVCGKSARQTEVKVGDYTEIRCRNCGHFQASGTFERVAPAYPVTIRLQALDRTRLRARYGLPPLVTTYDLP